MNKVIYTYSLDTELKEEVLPFRSIADVREHVSLIRNLFDVQTVTVTFRDEYNDEAPLEV